MVDSLFWYSVRISHACAKGRSYMLVEFLVKTQRGGKIGGSVICFLAFSLLLCSPEQLKAKTRVESEAWFGHFKKVLWNNLRGQNILLLKFESFVFLNIAWLLAFSSTHKWIILFLSIQFESAHYFQVKYYNAEGYEVQQYRKAVLDYQVNKTCCLKYSILFLT